MKQFFRERLRSLGPALKGGGYLLRTQPNAWVHAVATAGVAGAGWLTGLDRTEWLMVGLAAMAVWMAEAFNTAIEQLADEVTQERRERLGRAKDLGALAVLMAAVGAVGVGLTVFLPHWWGSVAD